MGILQQVLSALLSPVLLEWQKACFVQWLRNMSAVGRQTEYDDALFGSHLYHVWIEMRGVAIQKQKEWSPFGCRLKEVIEEPRLEQLTVHPPTAHAIHGTRHLPNC